MKARIVNNVIEIIPTKPEEVEFLKNITGMKLYPKYDISTVDDTISITVFKKIQLFCQLSNNGMVFDDMSIEP